MTLLLYRERWHAQGIKIIIATLVSKLVTLLIYIFLSEFYPESLLSLFIREHRHAT